jgi:hypothetical protein
MTDEEQQIITFLNSSPETYFARREIARRAVRRQVYEENQHWVDAPLSALVMKGIVEKNDSGQYRARKDEVLR